MTAPKKRTDERVKIVVKLTPEQHERLLRFAERRGLSIGPLLRTLGLEAAAQAGSQS